MSDHKALVLRGIQISEDANGNISLDDIWRLAKARDTRLPKKWRITQAAIRLAAEVQKKVTNSSLKENSQAFPVLYAKRGRGNVGTFAHPILAAAYAGYLSPKLEVEVREIWLRYRAGDATLADEILQRASAEANAWAGVRAMSRAQRVGYTKTLQLHGVYGSGYRDCTESLYLNLLGNKSYEIRNQRGLSRKANLRENMDIAELSFVMAAEALSAERIEEEKCTGNIDCEVATGRSAAIIRRAIDEDRKSRQPKML
jgi:hypothetical protein